MDTHNAEAMFIHPWGNSMKGTVTNKFIFHIREHFQVLSFANPSSEIRIDFDHKLTNNVDLSSVTTRAMDTKNLKPCS